MGEALITRKGGGGAIKIDNSTVKEYFAKDGTVPKNNFVELVKNNVTMLGNYTSVTSAYKDSFGSSYPSMMQTVWIDDSHIAVVYPLTSASMALSIVLVSDSSVTVLSTLTVENSILRQVDLILTSDGYLLMCGTPKSAKPYLKLFSIDESYNLTQEASWIITEVNNTQYPTRNHSLIELSVNRYVVLYGNNVQLAIINRDGTTFSTAYTTTLYADTTYSFGFITKLNSSKVLVGFTGESSGGYAIVAEIGESSTTTGTVLSSIIGVGGNFDGQTYDENIVVIAKGDPANYRYVTQTLIINGTTITLVTGESYGNSSTRGNQGWQCSITILGNNTVAVCAGESSSNASISLFSMGTDSVLKYLTTISSLAVFHKEIIARKEMLVFLGINNSKLQVSLRRVYDLIQLSSSTIDGILTSDATTTKAGKVYTLG